MVHNVKDFKPRYNEKKYGQEHNLPDIECNGFLCHSKNTVRINVDAGSFGKLQFWLCQSCLKKFRE
jgi:hypothetical protein